METRLQNFLIDDLEKLEKNINILVDMINTTHLHYADTKKPLDNIDNFISYWKQHTKTKAVNQIVLPTCYTRNKDGSITYDFEMMAEEFENELSKLDKNIVIMCSVETNPNK